MKDSIAPTGIRFPPEVRAEAKRICANQERSMNWYVVKAVREMNKRENEKSSATTK